MCGNGEAICSNGEAIVLLDYSISSGSFLNYEIKIGDGPGPELDNIISRFYHNNDANIECPITAAKPNLDVNRVRKYLKSVEVSDKISSLWVPGIFWNTSIPGR